MISKTINSICCIIIIWIIPAYFDYAYAHIRRPIIISTDVATGLIGGWLTTPNDIDDGLAVLSMLNDQRIDVLGITTIFGNNDNVQNEYLVAKRLESYLPIDRRPIVVNGSNIPLSTEETYWYDSREKIPILVNPCVNDAVRFMANKLYHSKTQITLLALGPLTDIGCLIKTYPQLDNKIDKIVALMGRNTGQITEINNRPFIDFNYVLDPRAAQIVLKQKKIPLVLMPFNVIKSVFISFNNIPIPNKSNKLAIFLYGATKEWSSYWMSTFGQRGFYPWDLHVAFYEQDNVSYKCTKNGYLIVPCTYENNLCAGHNRPILPGSFLGKETSQLWLSPSYTNSTQVIVCDSLKMEAKNELIKELYSLYR